MDTAAHQLIAQRVYDALPRAAQDFVRASDVEIDFYARAPDVLYKDNLYTLSSCEGENHFHSYKIDWDRKADTMTLITGSVHDALASESRVIHNAVIAGRFDEARLHLLQTGHYTVDACTLPHLTHELTPEQHGLFETQIADYMAKEAKFPVEQQLLQHPAPLLLITRDLRGTTEAVCKETVRLQLDRVKAALKAGKITDDVPLCQEIVARCMGFTLAVWLFQWRICAKLSPGVEI